MMHQKVIIEFSDGSTATFRGLTQVDPHKMPKIKKVRFTVPKQEKDEFNFFDEIFKRKEKNYD